MEKYELQRSVQDAENQVADFKNQIRDYERKIAIYRKDYTKIADMYENMERGYKRKRADVDVARVSAKGIALTSYITHLDELYGYDKWRKAAVSFENIEEVIQENIRKAKSKINELQGQITYLENHISGWRDEIRSVERREEKCKAVKEKAGHNCMTKKGVR